VLTVTHLELPDEVMGLEGDGLPRQVLPNVASLKVGARVELLAGHPSRGGRNHLVGRARLARTGRL